MKVKDLKPAAYNPRTITDEKLSALGKSMKEYGDLSGIVRNIRTGNLVGGHQRIKHFDPLWAIKKRKHEDNTGTVALGEIETPFGVWSYREVDWPEKREKAANVSANQSGGLFDYPALQVLFDEINDGTLDMEMIGFDEGELKNILEKYGDQAEPKDAEPQIDQAEELNKVWGVKTGDLWQIGHHRLLCGDSTKKEDVGRVMGGEKAVIMNTDPPYGIAYVKNAKSKKQAQSQQDIENDDLDGEKLQKFLEETIRSAVPHLIENAAFYLWHPMLTQGTFFAAAAAADILIHRQIIWVKPSLVFGRGDYHWRHELCFYGWIKGNRPAFYGQRNQTTIWEVGRESDNLHPTQKPLELFNVPLLNHTKEGESAYEPFGGSGSQFVSCQNLNRKCRGIEISPAYCAVILQRMFDAFEIKGVRVD